MQIILNKLVEIQTYSYLVCNLEKYFLKQLVVKLLLVIKLLTLLIKYVWGFLFFMFVNKLQKRMWILKLRQLRF